MRILAIETSCDETAVCVLEANGGFSNARFNILGNQLLSQVELHRAYGGVYPNLAKREHARNLVPLLEETLREAELLETEQTSSREINAKNLRHLLSHEPELFQALVPFLETSKRPGIDAVAVTVGPGLEPALWVGINFAKALSRVWNTPVIPINHMEGHIAAGLLTQCAPQIYAISHIQFPVLTLLISGGHTELVLMRRWGVYEMLGKTRDDAVGEAFDKVARLLGLPYPGGPEISRLAEAAREAEPSNILQNVGIKNETLPRPMIDSGDLDFSFSGLKTAVLYRLKKLGGVEDLKTHDARLPLARERDRKEQVPHETKTEMALAFEDAVTDVLAEKTIRALKKYGVRTLVVGGGVSANKHIRRVFQERMKDEFPSVSLSIPEPALSTDNAIMIGIAGYYRHLLGETAHPPDTIAADGNLALAR